MNKPELDEQAYAAMDLVGRSGARKLEIGYLNEDAELSEDADWYAQALFQGERIIAEHHRGPSQALEALATRLLTGAKCTNCDGLVALSPYGAFAFPREECDSHFTDGSQAWTQEQLEQVHMCLWQRKGTEWLAGCQTTG